MTYCCYSPPPGTPKPKKRNAKNVIYVTTQYRDKYKRRMVRVRFLWIIYSEITGRRGAHGKRTYVCLQFHSEHAFRIGPKASFIAA
jgi:hypothetical protein